MDTQKHRPDTEDVRQLEQALFETVLNWAAEKLEPGAAQRDANGHFDYKLYGELCDELGLTGITLPEELDGAGLDLVATIMVIEALSRFDPGIAMSYLAHELLFTHQLYYSWKDANLLMPEEHFELLRRRPLAGLAMTEADAGTDILGMRTWARPCEEGYILNGSKAWITNAPLADVFLVYARTGEARRDISLFLVDGDNPGLHRGKAEPKMGMHSSPTGSLTFIDCSLPHSALVGRLNDGLRHMLRNLAAERLGLAAQACGISERCFEVMRNYASERQAFGQSIVNFGQIQRLLAESYAMLKASKSMLSEGLEDLVAGKANASLDADAVKLFCTQAAETISRSAIQVLGANGYSAEYPVERLHRDSILLSIGGGTNEALQKNIARQLTKNLR